VTDRTGIGAFLGIVAVLDVAEGLTEIRADVAATQTMRVVRAGATLGPWRELATLVPVARVAIGFPSVAGGREGLGVLLRPSAGCPCRIPAFSASVTVTHSTADRTAPPTATPWRTAA
jgi:biotin transporter BioY